jgi:uncharacterized protein
VKRPHPLPRAAVAALFLERQHLARPRARRLSPARLVRFAEDVGGIQLDSINVLDRAHHLTLWSRFGPYDRQRLARLVYRKRLLFEYWAHAACLVPATHLPMWRRVMLDYEVRHTGWTSWLRKHEPTMGAVLTAIRERGPLGNADFEDERPRGSAAGWWSWKPESHALDYLWKKGVLGVAERVHFQRRLDLFERLFPGAADLEPPSPEEFRRWHALTALRAMGAASPTDLRMYLTYPRFEVADRRATLAALRRSGEVVEVAVEGQRGPWLARAGDVPALERAARRRTPASRGTTFLAPFDSLLWHRERVLALFGFDYRIEVYTPGHKRVHGYYSLPILHGGALIGRLDAKNHREARRLEVRHVHFEPWFVGGGTPYAGARPVAREPAPAGIGEALRSLAEFVGANDVTLGRVTPGTMKAPLRAALAGAGA